MDVDRTGYAEGVNALARARVSGDDDRFLVPSGKDHQDIDKLAEPLRRVDIFFPMRTDDEIAPRRQPEPVQHLGSLDPRPIVCQHLPHRAAGERVHGMVLEDRPA